MQVLGQRLQYWEVEWCPGLAVTLYQTCLAEAETGHQFPWGSPLRGSSLKTSLVECIKCWLWQSLFPFFVQEGHVVTALRELWF